MMHDIKRAFVRINYGKSNVQMASSTYTSTNGTTRAVAAFDLLDNPFYRTFVDNVPLSAQAQTLPNMIGSGAVRNLREAA